MITPNCDDVKILTIRKFANLSKNSKHIRLNIIIIPNIIVLLIQYDNSNN